MRGGVLPPALLFVALGLALSFTPPRVWKSSCLALFATLVACSSLPARQVWLEAIFLGCWISVILTAACVHVIRGLPSWAAVALSVNAGFWASAVVGVSGSRLDLLTALSGLLILFPASWAVARHVPVPVKVVSSWIVAIAVLAATLQWLPVTPGYLPDHLE